MDLPVTVSSVGNTLVFSAPLQLWQGWVTFIVLLLVPASIAYIASRSLGITLTVALVFGGFGLLYLLVPSSRTVTFDKQAGTITFAYAHAVWTSSQRVPLAEADRIVLMREVVPDEQSTARSPEEEQFIPGYRLTLLAKNGESYTLGHGVTRYTKNVHVEDLRAAGQKISAYTGLPFSDSQDADI